MKICILDFLLYSLYLIAYLPFMTRLKVHCQRGLKFDNFCNLVFFGKIEIFWQFFFLTFEKRLKYLSKVDEIHDERLGSSLWRLQSGVPLFFWKQGIRTLKISRGNFIVWGFCCLRRRILETI